jgi:hypothetical protein
MMAKNKGNRNISSLSSIKISKGFISLFYIEQHDFEIPPMLKKNKKNFSLNEQ